MMKISRQETNVSNPPSTGPEVDANAPPIPGIAAGPSGGMASAGSASPTPAAALDPGGCSS
jgi:hypothetical protein